MYRFDLFLTTNFSLSGYIDFQGYNYYTKMNVTLTSGCVFIVFVVYTTKLTSSSTMHGVVNNDVGVSEAWGRVRN